MSTVQSPRSSDRRARAFRQRQRRRTQRPHQTLLDLVYRGLELGGNLLAPHAHRRAYFSFGSVSVANDPFQRRSKVVYAHADALSDATPVVELNVTLVDDRALTPRAYARHISGDAGDRLLRRIQKRCSLPSSLSPLSSPLPLGDAMDADDAKTLPSTRPEKKDDIAEERQERDDEEDERDGGVVDFFEWAACRYASLSVDSHIRTEFLLLASIGREFGATQRSFTAAVSVADAQLLLADLVVRRQLMSSAPTPSVSSSSRLNVTGDDWRRGRAGTGPTYFHVHVQVPAYDSEPWRESASMYSVDSCGRPLRTTCRTEIGAVSDDETCAADAGDKDDDVEWEGGDDYEYRRAAEPRSTATTTVKESKDEKVDCAPVKPELSSSASASCPEDDGERKSLVSDGQRRGSAGDGASEAAPTGDRDRDAAERRRVVEIRMNAAWTVVTRAQRQCLHGLAAAAAAAVSTTTIDEPERRSARPSVSFQLPAPLAHLEAQLVAESSRRATRKR